MPPNGAVAETIDATVVPIATAVPPTQPRDVPQAPAAAVPPSPTPEPPTLQRVRSQWDRIRTRAGEQYRPLLGPLSQATVDALEGDRLSIGVVDKVQEEIVRGHGTLVEAAVLDVLGVALRVRFQPRSAAVRGARPAPAPIADATAASAGDPRGEIDLMAYARERLGKTE